MSNDSAYTVLAIAVVGVLATCVGGLIWVIKFMFTRLIPRLDKGNVAFDKIAVATKSNTKAITRADDYLRTRNGHEAEQHMELIKAIAEIPEQIQATAALTAKVLVDTPPEQHIGKQEVKTQVVKERK